MTHCDEKDTRLCMGWALLPIARIVVSIKIMSVGGHRGLLASPTSRRSTHDTDQSRSTKIGELLTSHIRIAASDVPYSTQSLGGSDTGYSSGDGSSSDICCCGGDIS